MEIKEFETLEEFDSVDNARFKDYDRIVCDSITFLPKDIVDNALFKCYIREYGKYIIIKNETYQETYLKWKMKWGKRKSS